MRYVPFTKAKPLDADPLSGYNGYNGYRPCSTVAHAGGTLEDVATVANVATLGDCDCDPLMAYLAMLDGPEVLTLPGLPPSPYLTAPHGAWKARGLHAAAWAAWWAAIARQRAYRPAERPAA